mgnify:CR=1 FL=1|jgi:hypothetical protein
MTTLTYRYKLDSAILEQLRSFAGNHRYDEAIIFREAWKGWLIDNKVIIDREIARLREIGYIKDVKMKLYKSARYYFKNKSLEEKDPVKRREYIGTSKEFREAIDKHLTTIARNANLKPADAFTDFLENTEYLKILNSTRQDIKGYGFTEEMVSKKIKKTYKNRYFAQQKT